MDRVPIAPQEVDAPLTRSAVFLVLEVTGHDDAIETVRNALGDVSGLVKSVGFRDLGARLSCTVGIAAGSGRS